MSALVAVVPSLPDRSLQLGASRGEASAGPVAILREGGRRDDIIVMGVLAMYHSIRFRHTAGGGFLHASHCSKFHRKV